ncbi:MAG: PaaI family thioesterase [Actinobacteria bacterium]|nr:PaaI family thioesterase [Actinomycetota bacterium]
MDALMMKRMVESNCPFAGRSGMKFRGIGEDGTVVIILDDDPSNLNAFGLVHAGVICGLAETAGGMAIFHYLDPADTIVLNTILNIRFKAMPRGELSCEAVVVPEEARLLMSELERSGKADKAMDLKILNSSGETVAEAQASFRLMPTPAQFKQYFSEIK